MNRSWLILFPAALFLTACSTTQPVTFASTDDGVQVLQDAGFPCEAPEIAPQAEDETFSTVDCGRFALDLIPDMSAWEDELARDCGTLSSPDQREILNEIAVVTGPGWLIRSRDYSEAQQWQVGSEPSDFAAAFGGDEETLGQVCERLGGWD